MSKQKIVDYYEQSQIDYQLLWHLKNSLALHYGFWDETTKNLKQALKRENEVLAKIAKIKPTDHVLDAGCGVGGSSIFLAKTIGCKVTGISLVKKQIQEAKANAKRFDVEHLVNFKVADYTKTPFKASSFDVVWGLESVCVSPDKDKFIKESYRLLKKGGRLIVADYFLPKRSYQDREFKMLKTWLEGWAVSPLEYQANFNQHLKQTGFQKINFRDITQNIWRSSKRLYYYSFPGFVIGQVFSTLKLRSKTQTGNIIGAHFQYRALKSGLWKYGIFSAQK